MGTRLVLHELVKCITIALQICPRVLLMHAFPSILRVSRALQATGISDIWNDSIRSGRLCCQCERGQMGPETLWRLLSRSPGRSPAARGHTGDPSAAPHLRAAGRLRPATGQCRWHDLLDLGKRGGFFPKWGELCHLLPCNFWFRQNVHIARATWPKAFC